MAAPSQGRPCTVAVDDHEWHGGWLVRSDPVCQQARVLAAILLSYDPQRHPSAWRYQTQQSLLDTYPLDRCHTLTASVYVLMKLSAKIAPLTGVSYADSPYPVK